MIGRLRAPVNEKLEERKAERAMVRRGADDELLCLVQGEGWGYAQLVAKEIAAEYKCKPTDPEWQTLTTIQYAFDELFTRINRRALVAAQAKGLTIAEKENDSRSRGIDGGIKRRSTSRRRPSTGG